MLILSLINTTEILNTFSYEKAEMAIGCING